MCAIFGIIGEYKKQEALEAFETLGHRGSDERSILEGENYFLGVHRLAITDAYTPSIQPLCIGGMTLLLNGEIYNYQTLADELGIKTQSDTLVAHYAYQKWGDDFVHHLRGMFAIAIVEGDKVKLFRDPFGKKPLYYTVGDSRLIFASELKAIHRLKPLDFDRKIITQYLSFQSPITPYTFDKNVKQVGIGGSVIWDKKTLEIEENIFYNPLETPTIFHTSTQATQAIETTLLESVKLRLPQEQKCAVLLSGGLDSSLIASIASRYQQIETFCIGYEGYENYDERPFARRVAEHIGSIHHEVIFTREDFLATIKEVVEILDEPLGDPAMLPLYHLMKHIKQKGFKVVLTGDGSDELFMGYKPYKEFYDLEKASGLQFKNWLKNYFKANFSMHKEWEWYKRIFEETTLFRSSAEVFTDRQQNRLLRMNVSDNHSLKIIEKYQKAFEQSQRTSPIEWYSFLDLKVMLGEVFLRKLDRMSMAHSIEARSPFLDKEVVQSVFACDPALRLTPNPKALLKIIAQTYLPQETINRKKKGFNYPFVTWLEESGELDVIARIQKKMHLFNESEIAFYVESAKKGAFQQHIFVLYFLCKWWEKEK